MKTQQETIKTRTVYKEKFTKAAKGKTSEHNNVRDRPLDIREWEKSENFIFVHLAGKLESSDVYVILTLIVGNLYVILGLSS